MIMARKAKAKEMEVAVAEVIDYLKLTGQFAPALRDIVVRKATADAARKSRLRVTTKQLQRAADTFRAVNGLTKATATQSWLRANGITLEALEDYLETNLLISKYKDRLEKKAAKTKYLSSKPVKETVKEMIYRDWLKKALV